MIGSTSTEQKAVALFLGSSIETRLFGIDKVSKQSWLPHASALLVIQNNGILMDKKRKANQSFDVSCPIKPAKFRVFIHSKIEHKIN